MSLDDRASELSAERCGGHLQPGHVQAVEPSRGGQSAGALLVPGVQLAEDRGGVSASSTVAIREALAAGRGPSRIARHAGWTKEYIAKIGDGKTKA